MEKAKIKHDILMHLFAIDKLVKEFDPETEWWHANGHYNEIGIPLLALFTVSPKAGYPLAKPFLYVTNVLYDSIGEAHDEDS